MSQAGAVRTWVIAYVLVAGAGLGGLIGIGCAVKANFCPWRKPPLQTTTDGMVLYANNCAVCHGPDLRGRNNAPSLVSGTATASSTEELIRKISRGKPLAGMPRFERSLTAQQIRAVAEYIVAQRGGNG